MPTVYVTAPADAGADLARALVERRLAACVNRVPCESTYRWEGEVIDDAEELLLVKTTPERYDDLCEAVRELHPHDVPCIERFEATDVDDAFAAWIADAVE